MKIEKELHPAKRILGRRLARETTREELEQATGAVAHDPTQTMTMSMPPDDDPDPWPL